MHYNGVAKGVLLILEAEILVYLLAVIFFANYPDRGAGVRVAPDDMI